MENVESIIIEHLRAMRADTAGIREDMREVKQRLASVETGIGGLKRDASDLYMENAAQR